MCFTTKTNCSGDELCYLGIGKAGKCDAKVLGIFNKSFSLTWVCFPFDFPVSVLDLKVMGCLPMEACNKTKVVEFLPNKTLYTLKTSCCEEDFCNASPSIQLSLAPLLLVLLLITEMMGVF